MSLSYWSESPLHLDALSILLPDVESLSPCSFLVGSRTLKNIPGLVRVRVKMNSSPRSTNLIRFHTYIRTKCGRLCARQPIKLIALSAL
jgi:hypothetical protein